MAQLRTYVDRAIEDEDIMIKLGRTLYIPTSPGSGLSNNSHSMQIDGLEFGLEECSDIGALEASFYNNNKDEVFDFLASSVTSNKAFSDHFMYYVKQNTLLEFAADIFSKLKQEISYQDYLSMNSDMFYFPDEHQLHSEFNDTAELKGEFKNFNLSAENAFLRIFPENALFVSGNFYCLDNYVDRCNSIKVTIDGKHEYYPHHLLTRKEFQQNYSQLKERILLDQFGEIDLHEQMKLHRQARYKILQQFKSEDYLSYGFFISPGDSETELIMGMTLPRMAYPIPSMNKYLFVKQSMLLSKVSYDYSRIEFSRIQFKSESEHPLIYRPDNTPDDMKSLVGQVCLRGAEDEQDACFNMDSKEGLRRLFMLNRSTLMYAYNLQSFWDHGLMFLTEGSVNPHNVKYRRFRHQRVNKDFVKNKNIMIIGENNESN